MNLAPRHLMLAGFAVIVLTNAVALGGAAWNRHGEPECTLDLSERELRPTRDGGGRESSGLALRLQWRTLAEGPATGAYGYPRSGPPAWLDDAKMASLGFEARPPASDTRELRSEPSREVFFALELDGPAYRKAREAAEEAAAKLREGGKPEALRRADEWLIDARDVASRLFAVDAAADAQSLRAKYPDTTRYAIVRGRVRPITYAGAGSAAGTLESVLVDTIHVPLELRGPFEGLDAASMLRGRTPAARFDARVSFGRRLEPWLATAARKP